MLSLLMYAIVDFGVALYKQKNIANLNTLEPLPSIPWFNDSLELFSFHTQNQH